MNAETRVNIISYAIINKTICDIRRAHMVGIP